MKLASRIDPDASAEGGEMLSVVERLALAADKLRETAPTFSMQVAGLELFFRRPRSLEDLRTFERSGLEFVQQMTGGTVHPDWKEIVHGLTVDDFIAAYALHWWSEEPTKISQLQALRIVRAATLSDRIMRHLNRVFEETLTAEMVREVDVAKKDSSATGQDVCASQSRRKSTAATSTISRQNSSTD